jgi:RloB-like protein
VTAIRRENSATRRPPSRTQRRRLLVYCGGAESTYLTGLYTWADNPAVMVRPAPDPVAATHLIAMADEYRAAHPDAVEEAWCVADVDDLDLASVTAHAAAAGVHLALSNPGFETWLLLHFHDRPLAAMSPEATVRLLRRYRPEYDPRRVDFADFAGGLAAAIDRARALDVGEPAANPSTGMWRLATIIAHHKVRAHP